ncbi:MAG: NAD(P)H-hydrate dehydratase [Gemmatimonadaceae bacterium]|nr:NAD(P)H-hydrate dehydratase [Gemmatimonadaceae bacterium]
MTPVRVVTAAQAADRDARAIGAGTPSRVLMQAAGRHAAAELMRHAGDRARTGVDIYAGGGNNGGDAWVVAAVLAAQGVPVRVHEVEASRTDDARAEKEAAASVLQGASAPPGHPGVVVDGLLGTGARGAPRGDIARACADIDAARAGGAFVVALDVPSGLDASTGTHDGAPRADLTVTFGTIKRGHLTARDWCGAIVVVDIGLGAHADLDDGAPILADAAWVRSVVPRISADAHKGARKKVVIVGGARGMAGAVILAGRAALHSGVGLVKLVVAPDNVDLVQRTVPEALAAAWPADNAAAAAIGAWADALLVGPGLGRGPHVQHLVEQCVRGATCPVVIDADALNAYEGEPVSFAALIGTRRALITPHPLEFARLSGESAASVNTRRFDVAHELARATGATVLLKGVPTVVSAPDGRSVVSASGTPVLGQGGSGDVLAGMAATLLAQCGDPLHAGAAAAWVHGCAAELAAPDGAIRGVTLDDVLAALRQAWKCEEAPHPSYVLAELAAVGEP